MVTALFHWSPRVCNAGYIGPAGPQLVSPLFAGVLLFELVRCFASVINEIPAKDLNRLQQTTFLPGNGATVKPGEQFKTSDLYAPDPATVTPGLTQINLPFEFKPTTREGVLLLRFGLLRQCSDSITIANVLHRAGQAKDLQLYTRAMDYFLINHDKNSYTGEHQKFAALHSSDAAN